MPKISIYVPDALYDEVRRRRVPLSAVAQRAFEDAVRSQRNQEWIDAARQRAPRVTAKLDTAALLAEVRVELGA